MNTIKQFIIIITFSISLASFPAFAEQNTTSINTSGTYIKASGLCVGGAILGTFIPIFGNILGCAIGAATGVAIEYFGGDSEALGEEPIVAHR